VSATDDVLSAAEHLVRAFGRHDEAAYFECFAPEATFIFHTTPGRLESVAEYRDLWRTWEREDDFRVLACSSTGQHVQDLGEVAVFSHDVTTVTRSRRGEETAAERETIVFRRDGDRWLAVHEHLSPDPARAGAATGY